MIQSSLGRKGIIWRVLPHHCSSLKEDRLGTQTGQEQKQQLMQRLMEEHAYWLPQDAIF